MQEEKKENLDGVMSDDELDAVGGGYLETEVCACADGMSSRRETYSCDCLDGMNYKPVRTDEPVRIDEGVW